MIWTQNKLSTKVLSLYCVLYKIYSVLCLTYCRPSQYNIWFLIYIILILVLWKESRKNWTAKKRAWSRKIQRINKEIREWKTSSIRRTVGRMWTIERSSNRRGKDRINKTITEWFCIRERTSCSYGAKETKGMTHWVISLYWLIDWLVFNANFNNISAILCRYISVYWLIDWLVLNANFSNISAILCHYISV